MIFHIDDIKEYSQYLMSREFRRVAGQFSLILTSVEEAHKYVHLVTMADEVYIIKKSFFGGYDLIDYKVRWGSKADVLDSVKQIINLEAPGV